MRILITGVGGPTPRSFAIALKMYSRKQNWYLVGTDTNPLSIGLYQSHLFDKTYLVPKANDELYWDAIQKIIKDEQLDYAVILPEAEVLQWSQRQEKHNLPVKALLPDRLIAELLINKARMTEALKPLDVVPLSVEFSRDQVNFTTLFQLLPPPFWVRSSSGTSGLGSLKIESEQALRNWITINPNVETFLASEFLSGRNLACKLLYFEGQLVRAACAERVNYVMAKVAPSGITGNTSFGRLLNEPNLVKVAQQAMDHLFKITFARPHGFFTVDFKEDGLGRPLITEINVRHVAFTQCLAAAGANFAEDTLQLLSNDITFDNTFKVYEFENDLIFLRDVDSLPVIMKESSLKGI